MMSLGQKVTAYAVLLFLNVLFLYFFGILAIVPIIFSILFVSKIRKL